MPTLTDFLTKFTQTDLTITAFIILLIVGIRERKNILKLFGYGKEEKKENTHTEE